jgi:glycosyltransferase involved in cell wall biosynthesis
MRIGIDARFFGPSGKGLGRYTQKLVENIEKIYSKKEGHHEEDVEFFVFLRRENFSEYVPRQKNVYKVLADCQWYTFREQLEMPMLLRKYNLDLVHFPHFNVPILYGKKFIVTIHDLILIHFPTLRGTTLNPLFYWLKFLAYKLTIMLAIKRAKKIITVSNFTRNDILANYQVASEKIAVIYEASDDYCELSIKEEEPALEKYGIFTNECGIIKPYILYVGNAYPHKNLEKLILSFSRLFERNKELKLVLVGKEDYFYKNLKKLVQERNIQNIIFAGFVPDCDLSAVYKNSIAYVFPSLYEGFGIPPLEAMASGTPVASSNHPCMQEVLGESALYFDATKEEAIAEVIERLVQDEVLQKSLIEKGYKQIKKYNWEKMAKETIDIYNEVLRINGK